MREVKYLSPSSIRKFYDNRSEFYLSYLTEERPPKMSQTQPMSVGSAFDAFIKNHLAEKLVGSVEDRFKLETILESQVEEPNRTWAPDKGAFIFEQYKALGALADLMLELEKALDVPRMEFKVEGRVAHESVVGGIPLLGKPDLHFMLRSQRHCVYDFKVNGFCGKSATSPKAGYMKCRGGSRDSGGPHKNAVLMDIDGITVNIADYLESFAEDWAEQLAIYAWLLGEPVGGDFIVGIEQIVSQGAKTAVDGLPRLRVASHRSRISKPFQEGLFKKIARCWEIIESGWIFDDLTREQSDQRCRELDQYHKAFATGEAAKDPKEQWFNRMVGR